VLHAAVCTGIVVERWLMFVPSGEGDVVDEAGVSLRPASSADRDFLGSMVVAAVNWDRDRPPKNRDEVLADPRNAHYVEGWPRPSDVGAVALSHSGAPIGAAWLRLFPSDDAGYGFVAADVPELSLGVVDGWRGRGVGRRLLRDVVRRGAAAGFERVSLSVERANRARQLYVDEGFLVVGSDADADTMLLTLSR
jgi:GNAT superfamily N-acetyltransferase